MEARHLLKQLKDDDWYLGDTEGSCRQYVHPVRAGVITVCVRYTDLLGPGSLEAAMRPAEAADSEAPSVVVETTTTGASAYSPELSGCVATGDDEAEARDRMAGALALHRRALDGDGA
jgi:predicted RNA binding protein YcfA (HicA-like mRNA interferase family)